MTIREVIEMLKEIFAYLMQILGPLFEGKDAEAEGETEIIA